MKKNKNLIPCNELPPPYSFEQMSKDLDKLSKLINKRLKELENDK